MDMNAQTREWMNFANELADAARGILLPAMARERRVEIKADASMVTDVDRAIETRLREMIERRYPSHGVLGEEHGSRDLDAQLVWVLDPIDGTAPFVAGIPVFGTLIGLAQEGRPYLGIIDHPATLERFTGAVDGGAFRNERAIQVRPCAELAVALMTNSNPDFLDASELARFAKLRPRVRYTQYGGSCYAYAMLAAGNTDIAVDGGLDAFDIFAPAALIQAAGGVVTDWTGSAITLAWSGRVLAAGDPQRHDQVRGILDPGGD